MKPRQHWSWVWIVCVVGACAIFIWNTAAKIDHLDYLSTIGTESENHTPSEIDAVQINTELTPNNSLPIPDQLTASYHWLAQTQRMLNRGEARVRHIDYENAPFGRTVLTPSPYRWWLGFVAWCEHRATGVPSSKLVEKAALWADPAVWGIIILGFVILSAKYFGSLSASLVSVGLVSLYPFITGFLPGAPDDRGLAEALAIASVMFLSVAAVKAPENERARRRWFILAGVAGGVGLWVKVPVQLPVLVGVIFSGLFVSFLTLRSNSRKAIFAPPLPWRAWACAGAATTIIASFVEYTPPELRACELSFIHPLHGLAWLGAGELLAQIDTWTRTKAFSRSPKNLFLVSLSLAAMIAVPIVLLKHHGAEVFFVDGMGSHLSRLHDGIVARNFAVWLGVQGPSIWLFLTLIPLGVLLSACWVLTNNNSIQPARTAVAIALGPVFVALVIACVKLSWWQTVDALLLVVLAATAAAISSKEMAAKIRIGWICITLGLLLPGLVYVLAFDRPSKGNALNETEVQDLILRDLAGWIKQHAEPGAVTVFSPPSASTALCYYGAFRGMGSVSEENKDGIVAAVRIMSNRSLAEVKEVISRRKITHVVLLSWDTFFDDSARAAAGRIEGTFRDQLKFNTLPVWLRPLAYPLPSIPGFEDQSVTVFEVVDDQDEAAALSNIALYFVEMGNMDGAQSVAQGLTHFPIDVGAWVARAQVAAAIGDDAELAKALKVIQARLAARVQPLISWNLRVDLAVVLARAKVEASAKKQLQLCIDTIDDAKIRSLSPGSVYRLLVMCRGFGVSMPPAQRALALSLVPPTLRARMQ